MEALACWLLLWQTFKALLIRCVAWTTWLWGSLPLLPPFLEQVHRSASCESVASESMDPARQEPGSHDGKSLHNPCIFDHSIRGASWRSSYKVQWKAKESFKSCSNFLPMNCSSWKRVQGVPCQKESTNNCTLHMSITFSTRIDFGGCRKSYLLHSEMQTRALGPPWCAFWSGQKHQTIIFEKPENDNRNQ